MITPLKIEDKHKSTEAEIKELKSWLSTQGHLPPIPDNMLHLFNHSCFSKVDKTKECIETYYTVRSVTPEVFTKRSLNNEDLVLTNENQTYFVLPKYSPEGYKTIYHRIDNPDSNSFIFDATGKMFFMALDSLIHEEGVCPGYMFLMDYKNIRLGHITKINVPILRRIFRYLQEGAPIRLKSIHMINVNFFVEKFISFIKPFMPKELFDLIHFYPEGQIEKLYEFIPLESLPSDYDGKLESCAELRDKFIDHLKTFDEFFKQDENEFQIKENLRPLKAKLDFYKNPSIKKLEID